MRVLVGFLGFLCTVVSWGQTDSVSQPTMDSLRIQLSESIRLWNDLQRHRYFQDSATNQTQYENSFIEWLKRNQNGDSTLKWLPYQQEDPVSKNTFGVDQFFEIKSNIKDSSETTGQDLPVPPSYGGWHGGSVNLPNGSNDPDTIGYQSFLEFLRVSESVFMNSEKWKNTGRISHMDPTEETDFDLTNHRDSREFGIDAIYRPPPNLVITEDWKRGPSQFDSRIEVYQLNGATLEQLNISKNVHSVGIIVEKENLQKVSDFFYELNLANKLGSVYRLCPGQAFADQPVLGVGTGFMIKKDTFLTAYHVFERPITDYVLVFGYQVLNRNGVVETFVRGENVYALNAIIPEISDADADFACFTVDREVNRFPLRTGQSTEQSEGSPVYCIGYPSGLPAKIAVNAGILKNDTPSYFFTTLDAFQGNSGSPVFDAISHEVIGILVSGQLDYVWRGNCNETTLFDYGETSGEKVVRIEQVLSLIRGLGD